MIDKKTQIRATCGGCLDYDKPKKIVDMYFDKPYACDAVTIIHSCPVCKKLSRAIYKRFSEGPVTSNNGYQVQMV